MSFIQSKIDEIRKKPEHIRIRYAWACAAGVTFLVVIIWMISLSANNTKEEITNQEFFTPEEMKPIEDLKTSGQDLKNATDQLKNSANSAQNQPKIGDQQSEGFRAQ